MYSWHVQSLHFQPKMLVYCSLLLMLAAAAMTVYPNAQDWSRWVTIDCLDLLLELY